MAGEKADHKIEDKLDNQSEEELIAGQVKTEENMGLLEEHVR